MADFSALIAQIEAYVKQNGNNEITGNGLQSILVGMVNAIGGALNDAVADLQGNDTTLTNSIGSEADARVEADNAIGVLIAAINGKIPSEASSSNKLADKAFVTTLTTALQGAVDAINANIGNGYVYAGVATPSGTPVSGKVVYLTAQAGTYTNYGGLVVPTGISVLKYNGTAWSQEQVISMADIYRNPLMGLFDCSTAGATAAKVVTADGYVLPTNGGSMKVRMANHTTVDNVTLNINGTGAKTLYYKGKAAGINNTWGDGAILNVMYDSTNSIYLAYDANAGTGDGVFDISDYTGDTYEDLVAALADVPVSERHGGMMVRFIQGSAPSVDNNYVQFRYLPVYENTTAGNAAFVNTDNWSVCEDITMIENPEFIKVYVDANNRIVKAVRKDGTEYLGAGLEVHGDISTDGADITMIENPEFAAVWLEKKGRILFGVQKNANFFFGLGVPQQIVNYVEKRIKDLSLDEYEDIVAFLGNLITGDETLTELLYEKVDKEEGKSLIDEDVAEGVHYEENPEFVKVELDAAKHIIKAIKNDGTEFFAVGVDVAGAAVGYSVNCPEYIGVFLDGKNRILMAFENDGNVYYGIGVPSQIKNYVDNEVANLRGDISAIQAFLSGFESDTTLLEYLNSTYGYYTENPEYIEAEIDNDNKVLGGRRADGKKFENVGFESPYINTNELNLSKGGLRKLSKDLSSKPVNRLPCLPQEIVDASGDDFVYNRCQNCLVLHKSFKPLLDFKGRLAHKTVVEGVRQDYFQYDLTTEILFEERLTLRLDTGSRGNTRIYTKHSDNLKDWTTETPSEKFGDWAYILTESEDCSGNDNSLLITHERVEYYEDDVLKHSFLPLWSLDGGLHFEPLINNYRGHFYIVDNLLNEGTIVTIGAKTYTCISSSDAHTAMEQLVGDDTDELVAAGLEYLADKIVISTNPQDALRMLAWHLVEEGYFVRLEDEELVVYSKIIGTAGNVQSDISIGNITYTFANGQDYTLLQLVSAAQILPSTLPVTHADGSPITPDQIWTYMSWIYRNGAWYMAMDVSNSNLTSIVVVKIVDIADAINTSTYKIAASLPCLSGTEPLLSYDKTHDIIFIGLREDAAADSGVIRYLYSTDGGNNYNMFTIENPSDNLSWKYDTRIFLAEAPNLFSGSLANEGYDHPCLTSSLIYVSVVYCRASGIAWVATADIPSSFDKDISKLEWSDFKPLNHFIPKDEKDWKPVLGDFPDYRLRSYDAGMGSVGAMAYSRLYKGIVVGYQGMKVIGKRPSFCMGVAIEHC